MTPIKKILLAAAFVAAGYGAASQFGAPQLQIIRRPQPFADQAPAPKPAPELRTALPNLLTDTGARLVPDVQPPSASTTFNSNVEDVLRDNFAIRSQSEFELASVSAPPLADGAATVSPRTTQFGPRASLRKEAPRPLVIQSRDEATLKNVPQPVASGAKLAHDLAPEGIPSGEAAYSAPSNVLQMQYSQNRTQFVDTPPTTDIVAAQVTPDDPFRPLPSAHDAIEDQSRLHYVVDGDSLAKLAQRYLDDPQRASEIYELNRNVLSHPDVLPIGVELIIPSRSASLHSNGDSPHSLLPHAPALHAASRGGLVPVRPVPAGAVVMPRAHLSQPRPVAGTLRVP